LLLDDDAGTLVALQALLERTKANVIECEDARCALDSCRTPGASIDIFVADVILPASNGPAIVREARPLQPRLRVLFISGFSLGELQRRGLLAQEDLVPGEIEFLQKPLSPDTFLARVEHLLQPRQ
jgi:DNA-binding NtrC family response regulator